MNKFDLGSFEDIVKVNKDIKKVEQNIAKDTTASRGVSKTTISTNTEEIDLGRLNIREYTDDIKKQKSVALKMSTIERINKLAKRLNTSASEIIDKLLREALELD